MNDKFKKQRKYLSRDLAIGIIMLVTGLTLVAISLPPRVIPIIIMGLFITFISLKFIVPSVNLIRQLTKIKTVNTQDILLSQPKITFLVLPASYTTRHNVKLKYYGLIIKNGKKRYYCLFEACYLYNNLAIEIFREKFDRELTIQCYEGTSIVRSVENDLHYYKIQSEYR